jgi:twitching motility protein PilT
MDFQSLLNLAVEKGASDLHLQASAPPMMRIGGQVQAVDATPLTHDGLKKFIASLSPPVSESEIVAAAVKGLDFSAAMPPVARFRCSAYCCLGQLGMVMRVIRTKIPSIDELHLPKVVFDIAMSGRGMTLVTGTTGSGKSTTLAAMIDLVNANERSKIITIEDPVEYLHPAKLAMMTQMELGSDTPSFDQALRQALRHDPDLILVGELRDVETLRMALRAADTGHQVFATVHSARAAQTIERIIAMFPPAEHKLLLSQLAHSIEAIISQRLVVTREAGKRRPALEILRGGPVTTKFIMEGRIDELSTYLEGGDNGMQSFDQHLLQMYHDRTITGTEALRLSTRPEAMATAMRGIKYVGGGAR